MCYVHDKSLTNHYLIYHEQHCEGAATIQYNIINQ